MGYIVGTPGNDNISGTPQNDTLVGLSGNDILNNNSTQAGGFDILFGNDGFDSLNLGFSVSGIAYGGKDNDQISGSNGADTVYGDNGADIIQGFGSNDILVGTNVQNDPLNDLADIIVGNLGNDTIYGNSGNDSVSGSEGNDIVFGGQGDDRVNGLNDTDILTGDLGNDTLVGGLGVDTVTGGSGNDAFLGTFGTGSFAQNTDVITDFNTGDSWNFINSPNPTIFTDIYSLNGDLYIDATPLSSSLVSRLILKGRGTMSLSDALLAADTFSTSSSQITLTVQALDSSKLSPFLTDSNFDSKLSQQTRRAFQEAEKLPFTEATVIDLPPGTTPKDWLVKSIQSLEKGISPEQLGLQKGTTSKELKAALSDIVAADFANALLEKRHKGLLSPGSIDPFTGNTVPVNFDPIFNTGGADTSFSGFQSFQSGSLISFEI